MLELVKSSVSSASRLRIVNNLLRVLAIAGLVLLLFWLGTYDIVVFNALDVAWQKLLVAFNLTDQLAALQRGVSGQVTRRSLLTMLTYSLLYTSICLLLVRLLLARGGHPMRQACLLYAGVFGACTLLLLGAKLAGDALWAYQLGRRLIDFIVSPVPVIILVPLLRWSASPKEQERL